MLDHTELLGQRLRSLLTGPGNSPGTLPSMPCTASLSQHALEGPTIPASPGDLTIPACPGALTQLLLRLHPLTYSLLLFFLFLSCTTSQNTVVKMLYLRQMCI